MSKWLFWVLVAVLARLAWQRMAARRAAPGGVGARRSRGSAAAEPPSASPVSEPMVACGVCGVYVPRSLAEPTAHGFYCGVAHRDQAIALGPDSKEAPR